MFTRLTLLTSGIMLTTDAYATTTSVAVTGKSIQGFVIVTSGGMVVALTFNARVGSEGCAS